LPGGNVVIATGAAGGIGRATTMALSGAGYGVVGIDIDPKVEELTCLEGDLPVLGVVASTIAIGGGAPAARPPATSCTSPPFPL
jgi:NAD(P)-dependent dehydrogenase (short-subunit alcohol dehydrogenase family)